MNKMELINKVAKDTRLTNRDATEVIEATIENIMKALQGGDEVRLVGFGTFTVSRRKASEGRPAPARRVRGPGGVSTRFGSIPSSCGPSVRPSRARP